jgi:hypothetical protein
VDPFAIFGLILHAAPAGEPAAAAHLLTDLLAPALLIGGGGLAVFWFTRRGG